MKWNNLKLNKCPKCGRNLRFQVGMPNYCFCICGFKISSKRFKEIVSNKVSQSIENHYRPDDEVPEVF